MDIKDSKDWSRKGIIKVVFGIFFIVIILLSIVYFYTS
jgi:hypothetical protein